MNKLLVVFGLAIGMLFYNTQPIYALEINVVEETSFSDYCDGWEAGYCEGWKDVKGSFALCPLTPLCPLAELGKNSYRDGYNRGFKAGMRKARD
ncbi:MAG: hypothetical protein WDZ45_02680 [Flavobacteriaceae bacterium]